VRKAATPRVFSQQIRSLFKQRLLPNAYRLTADLRTKMRHNEMKQTTTKTEAEAEREGG
jgi:hypothetical protein